MSYTVSSSTVKERIEFFWPLLGLILCLTGAMEAFPLSFILKSNVMIGLGLLPLVLRVRADTRTNYSFLILTILLGILGGYYGVRTFYFLSLLFYLLLITERYFGRVDSIVWFLLLFTAPFFHQIAVIIGFPVRLTLSSWAGNLMNLAGAGVEVQGNLMIIQGASFAVDDACMGLSMLSISMLAGIFALTYHSRHDRRRLSFFGLLSFFLTVFVINLFSNLLRIIALVMFHIGPDNIFHETMGLVCMVVYVLVPVYFLSRLWLTRWGKAVGAHNPYHHASCNALFDRYPCAGRRPSDPWGKHRPAQNRLYC